MVLRDLWLTPSVLFSTDDLSAPVSGHAFDAGLFDGLATADGRVASMVSLTHPADPDAFDYSLVAHEQRLPALQIDAPNGIVSARLDNLSSGGSFSAAHSAPDFPNALPGMSDAPLIRPAELGLHGFGTHAPLVPDDTSPSQSDEVSFISGIDSNGQIVAVSGETWNTDNPATYNASTSGAAKWGDNQAGTPGGTVHYYFDPGSHWNATEESVFTAGLTLWSDEANIHFVLTKHARDAQVTFTRNSTDDAFTNTSFSVNPGAGTIGTSDLHTIVSSITTIDTTEGTGWGPITGSFSAYGGYPLETVLHEEGHVLGLGHAGPYNGAVDPSTQQFSEYDSRLWSIMSYVQPIDNSAKYFSEYPVTEDWGQTLTDGGYWTNVASTPMALDIQAAQELYGASTSSTFSGGQTFGFHCNIRDAAKPFFDFTVDTLPIVTLYDRGLGNTLDLSGYASASTVSLFDGTFSSCAGLTNNICIAYGTSIDHAIGGSGDDAIVANNNTTNHLEGGAGNDTLTAGSGTDKLDGDSGNDTIKMGANLTAADLINGGGGKDIVTLDGDYSDGFTFGATTMVQVEKIELHNGFSYALTTNDATVAAGHTLTVDAPLLGVTCNLSFNGLAETNGRFVITGGAGDDSLIGGAGSDNLNGGNGNDLIGSGNGGKDVISGGAGEDTIIFTGDLTSADKIDGGDSNDIVILTGNYSTNLTFSAATMVNVETLQLGAGFSYFLTTNDATVASGHTLTVDGSALGASNYLFFIGTAETNGNFVITGGASNDDIVAGAGNDTLNGAAGDDSLILSGGGNDIANGGDGDDAILFGASLTAADKIDGGAGNDRVLITGDYSTPLTFSATTMVNVENLILGAGFNYDLVTNNATVAAGEMLTVDATALGASNTLTFNGSAETDGHFAITGGSGADILSGGLQADTLAGGGGADKFTYTAVGQSTGTTHDTITDFDARMDMFDLNVSVSGYDGEHTKALNPGSFNGSLASAVTAAGLSAGHAVLIKGDGTSGTLNGHLILVVDANGDGHYTGGSDYAFDITGATNLGSLGTGNFI